MGKLVYGVGVNDADYETQKSMRVDGKKVHIWVCPIYSRWKGVIERCYSEKFKIKNSAYMECLTVPEWHYFMTFRSWMIEQDWEGKHLDKDILFPGNKIYGPDTCVFVDRVVNNFILEGASSKLDIPVGVSFHKASGKFQASSRDSIAGKQQYLGIFDDPEEAHKVWLENKLFQARLIAAKQSDPRVAAALIDRYKI